MSTPDPAKIKADFKAAVNMPPATLSTWLETDESRSVGWSSSAKARIDGPEDGESVGHEMGRHIVELLHKKGGDIDDEDLKRMAKVVGYVHRHLAEHGPDKDAEHSRWRYSLMNWGHDPLKD